MRAKCRLLLSIPRNRQALLAKISMCYPGRVRGILGAVGYKRLATVRVGRGGGDWVSPPEIRLVRKLPGYRLALAS